MNCAKQGCPKAASVAFSTIPGVHVHVCADHREWGQTVAMTGRPG